MSEHDPLMERLAEANPVPPSDVQGEGSSATADRLLADLTGGRAHPSLDPRRSRPWKRSMVVVTVLLVVIVSITFVLQRAGNAPASASELLRRTAEVAANRRAPSVEGAYVYTKIEEERLRTSDAGGEIWSVVLPTTEEMWVAEDGSGRLRTVYEEPRFLGPRDRARWEAAGSPEFPTGVSDHTFSEGTLASEDANSLPTTLPELEGKLREDVASQDVPITIAVFQRVGELLSRSDAPPTLRAALYRVAARLPGVSLIGDTTDAMRRAGVAVGLTYKASGARLRVLMIFDEATSVLLSQERILLDRAPWVDAAPGTRLASVTYLASGRVDSVHDDHLVL
jgi:hypothetical protein